MKTFKEIKIYEVYVIKYKTRVYYSKGEKRYWSVKDTDVSNPKDAMRFKSGKDAQDELDGMNKAQRGNYEIVKEEDRDYKHEYKKFQSSEKMRKYRSELNKYNREKGTYGNRDGKDASHKDGKIVGMEDEGINRGRAEKSRLVGSKRK